MENEAPETQRVSSEPEGKGIFQEIDKHLLIVSDAAAALFSADTCSEARLTDAAPRRAHELAVPSRSERWTSHEPRSGSDLQFFVITITLLIVLGLGSLGGGHRYFGRSDELSGQAAVSALVERIIAVESNGEPNAKNSRLAQWDSVNFLMKPGLT
jgi:hypothetical protein